MTPVLLAIRASFVAVSFRQSARSTTIVVIAIVVVASAVSSAFDVITPPIVATRDLAFGAMGATIVGGVADLAANTFRHFAEEPFPQPLNLLSLEQTVTFFLLIKSLKKGRDRLEGCVL